MFCGNCGTQNPDNAAFCKRCGSQLRKQTRTYSAASNRLPVKKRPQGRRPSGRPVRHQKNATKLVVIAAIAMIAIIVLGTAFWMFGGRSYKATVKQFVNAQFDVDAEKLMKLIPDGVIEYMMDEEGFDDLDEMIDEANDNIQSQINSIERYLGKDWSVSYKITSVENIPSEELEKIVEDI